MQNNILVEQQNQKIKKKWNNKLQQWKLSSWCIFASIHISVIDFFYSLVFYVFVKDMTNLTEVRSWPWLERILQTPPGALGLDSNGFSKLLLEPWADSNGFPKLERAGIAFLKLH